MCIRDRSVISLSACAEGSSISSSFSSCAFSHCSFMNAQISLESSITSSNVSSASHLARNGFSSSLKSTSTKLPILYCKFILSIKPSVSNIVLDSLNKLDDKSAFLQEGIELEIESYEDEPINIVFPENISLEVSETEPTVKGQTAASSYKPAQLENGLRVMVPPFIQVGEKIIINTNDLSYVKRSE